VDFQPRPCYLVFGPNGLRLHYNTALIRTRRPAPARPWITPVKGTFLRP
jgi:hypothetical protein